MSDRDSNGRFIAGNQAAKGGSGRQNGATGLLTRLFADKLKREAENDTFHVGEFLMEVVQDENQSAELRARADSKLLDIVTKIQDDVPEEKPFNLEENTLRIAEILQVINLENDMAFVPVYMLTSEQKEAINRLKSIHTVV